LIKKLILGAQASALRLRRYAFFLFFQGINVLLEPLNMRLENIKFALKLLLYPAAALAHFLFYNLFNHNFPFL